MNRLIGLIPAAGKGTRAYPYTHDLPKGMLPIHGQPNIERLIAIMRDQLQIREIYIVIGYLGQVIRDYFKDGHTFGVKIKYLHNQEIEKGWAYSVLLGKHHIHNHFCVMLSDECYVGSNHHALLNIPYHEALATCAVIPVADPKRIQKNYAVEIDNGRIIRLLENPTHAPNNLLGLGTFILDPRIFSVIEGAYQKKTKTEVDLISLMGRLCRQGEIIKPFELSGQYVNINDRDSLNLAKYYIRRHMGDDLSASLLIHSENSGSDLNFTISQYLDGSRVDHVFVMRASGVKISDALLREPRLRIIDPPTHLKLYGEKIKYALDQMPGDILMITENDASFHPRDLRKLNAYLFEADMVIGTRTTRQLIEQGSNMRGIVRMANIFLAKLLEVLWWRMDCRFSDVGCTFRALWRTSYERIKEQLTARGPEFSVQMMIELLRARERIIEIPVTYYGRYSRYQNMITFQRMLHTIIKSRFKKR